jgi:hypothetical protein
LDLLASRAIIYSQSQHIEGQIIIIILILDPEPNPAPDFILFSDPDLALLKGIVQRNLTGVETRLKKSALLSHYTAQVPF